MFSIIAIHYCCNWRCKYEDTEYYGFSNVLNISIYSSVRPQCSELFILYRWHTGPPGIHELENNICAIRCKKMNLWAAWFVFFFYFSRYMCILNLSQTLLGIIWLKSEIHNPLSWSKMPPGRRAFLPSLRRKFITVYMRTQQISLSCKGEGNSFPLVVFISN